MWRLVEECFFKYLSKSSPLNKWVRLMLSYLHPNKLSFHHNYDNIISKLTNPLPKHFPIVSQKTNRKFHNT